MKSSESRISNKPTVTLRRHGTSPSAAGRAVIASMSGSSGGGGTGSIKMRTNPYVGWFRHSPPVAAVVNKATAGKTTKKKNNPWCTPIAATVPTSLKDCKNSPHIGWFRHAPPSSLENLKYATRFSSTISNGHTGSSIVSIPLSTATQEEKDLLWKLLQELNPSSLVEGSSSSTAIIVSGYLKGGGRDYMEKTRRGSRRALVNRHHQESSATTAVEGTMMSTVNALSQLASWFLFPVAHDAESCGYRRHDHHHYYGSSSSKPKKNKNKSKSNTGNDDGVLGQLFSYYLPNFLEEPSLSASDDRCTKYGTNTNNVVMRTSTDDSGDDDSYSSHSDSSSSLGEDVTTYHPSPKTRGNRSNDLTLSVSSLAEAYYAHQTTTKELSERHQNQPPSMTTSTTSFSAGVGTVSPHRLDYVITQMDIARMTRNAARHLDVQSIMSLPVVTYREGAGGVRGCAAAARTITTAATTKPSRGADQPGSWSWTIVEETEGGGSSGGEGLHHQGGATSSAAQQQQHEEDFCVICLEHFVDGDRLRVLPCDHSFHVGCIDRWLSGSQSFEECYTSGCPTCKKRPTLDGNNNNHNNNGPNKPRARSFCETTTTTTNDYERGSVGGGKHRSGSLDGSVPSWAFAQIGSALVAQQDQDQGISICSGVSSSS